jgi:phage/plasmid primase-like uncharacterized protein
MKQLTTNQPKDQERNSEYITFCQDGQVIRSLNQAAQGFIEEQSGQNISYLKLTNRWQFLDRKKRRGYIGNEGQTIHGVPYINVTYHDFQHGGYIAKFNSKAELRKIWEDYKRQNDFGPSFGYLARERRREILAAQYKAKEEQEAKAQALNVLNDLALWEKLSPTGESGYLKRKGFTTLQVFPSIKFGSDFVAALVVDIEGKFQGLQKIYVDGEKRFTWGLKKKNNFILLGELTGKITLIIVCEGLATGLTIRLAFLGQEDIVVICALDAGNIESVVGQLRREYGPPSKCEILLALDNDQWKEFKLNPQTGEPIGNTGLMKGNAAALKYRCNVMMPYFTGLDTTSQPTDFNDLMQLAGIEEVRRQLVQVQKPDLTYAFWRIYEKLRQQMPSNGILEHSSGKLRLRSRYLPETIWDDKELREIKLTDYLLRYSTVFIKSPIGTGKTELLARLRKENPNLRVLYITHYVSLAENGAKRLDLYAYTDLVGTGRLVSDMSFCLNSLPMLLKNGKLAEFDVVIIDECDQVLRRFTSQIGHKRLVLDVFRSLIKSAKHIIVLDAHLSEITYKTLKVWRPDSESLYIENNYPVGLGKTVILYENKGEIVEKGIEVVSIGGKVFLSFNGKKVARQVFNAFSLRCPDKKGLYVSADNAGDEDVQAFNRNPNEEAQKYDYIIATPSICAGLDINLEYFTFVGGVFSHNVNTPMDCIQAIGRVRKAQEIHLWVSQNKNYLPTDPGIISSQWQESWNYDLEMKGISPEHTVEFMDTDYENLYLNVKREEHFAKNVFYGRLLKLLAEDGYEIVYANSDEESKASGKKLMKEAAVREDNEYIETRVEAVNLTKEQAEEKEAKYRLTYDETRALDKFKVKSFYRLPEGVSEETVRETLKEDKRGKLRKQVSNLEVALADDDRLKELYRKEQEEGINLRPDMRKFATESELYRKVLQTVGIDEYLQTNGMSYTTEIIMVLIAWILSMRTVLQSIIPIPSSEWLQKNPLRFLGTLLRRMGLKQKRTGRADKGQYTIEEGLLQRMAGIIRQRGVVPLGVTWEAKLVASSGPPPDKASLPLASTTEKLTLPTSKIEPENRWEEYG